MSSHRRHDSARNPRNLSNVVQGAAVAMGASVLLYSVAQAEGWIDPPQSIDHFRGTYPVSQTYKNAGETAVKLVISNINSSETNQCSGSLINNYVLTAAHCFTELHGFTGGVVENSEEQRIGAINRVSYVFDPNGTDIALASTTLTAAHPQLLLKSLSSKAPSKGEVFATTEFPSGTMYQGSLIADGTINNERLFFTDPNNSPGTNQHLCQPGASGSLVLAGDQLGVIDTTVELGSANSASRQLDVKMPDSDMSYCGVTMLTPTLYDSLTSEFNK